MICWQRLPEINRIMLRSHWILVSSELHQWMLIVDLSYYCLLHIVLFCGYFMFLIVIHGAWGMADILSPLPRASDIIFLQYLLVIRLGSCQWRWRTFKRYNSSKIAGSENNWLYILSAMLYLSWGTKYVSGNLVKFKWNHHGISISTRSYYIKYV